MAMHIPAAPGYASMMKEGARFFRGIDETVLRNVQACCGLAQCTKSMYGPMGMRKLVINHIEKKFVTKDAATVLKNLEIEHPAAKLMLLACEQQENEAGESTNLVIILCAALLQEAEKLINTGLSVKDITEGFEEALDMALQILSDLTVDKVNDLRDEKQVSRVLRAVLMSKLFEYEQFFGELLSKACIMSLPDSGHFNVDNIRVVKILGGGLHQSEIVRGLVFLRDVEGEVKTAPLDSKVVIYSCPFDVLQTETKGTVLINSADELRNFSRGEETNIEARINEIAASGAKVVVTAGKVGDLALHFANRAGLMVVRLSSKFDLRRLCHITGATPLPKFTPPTRDELGSIHSVCTREFGRQTCVVFAQDGRDSNIVTLVVRGSMPQLMDEVERGVDDAVNAYKCLTRDPRLLAGAGAVELQLATKLTAKLQEDVFARTTAAGRPRLCVHAMRAFSSALQQPVTCLVENAGERTTSTLAQLMAEHRRGQANTGFVVTRSKTDSVVDVKPGIGNALEAGVVDLLETKYWALKYACDTAVTILRVNQIVMARPAGGPKPREMGPQDADDD